MLTIFPNDVCWLVGFLILGALLAHGLTGEKFNLVLKIITFEGQTATHLISKSNESSGRDFEVSFIISMNLS